MNYQYLNQHNQSTVETSTAISNMFVKQKSEIKHMHTMVVVVVQICVCFLGVSWPRQHIKGHIEPVNELLALFLGVDLLRLRAHVYHGHMHTGASASN